jgi:hypothetical protein
MNEHRTCYNCILRPMCKVFNFIFTNLPMDTEAGNEYHKKFNALYVTLAEACNKFNKE